MAKRVTKSGRIDRRFSSTSKGLGAQVVQEGGAKAAQTNLGEMPLTLFLVVAGIVLWLYVRRASVGIDKHPEETGTVAPRQPSVTITPRRGPPVLPPVGGHLSPGGT